MYITPVTATVYEYVYYELIGSYTRVVDSASFLPDAIIPVISILCGKVYADS